MENRRISRNITEVGKDMIKEKRKKARTKAALAALTDKKLENFFISCLDLANELTSLKTVQHKELKHQLLSRMKRIQNINKTGLMLWRKYPYRRRRIAQQLNGVEEKWDALVDPFFEKDRYFRQASDDIVQNNRLEDIKSKLDELSTESQQSDEETGHVSYDLLSYRGQLDKQRMLEMEIATQIKDLLHVGGLFNSDRIYKQGLLYKGQLDELKVLIERRRGLIQEILRIHTEVDHHLQWIKDREPAARSEAYGQNLATAQSLDKKHNKLEGEVAGHQPSIDNTAGAVRKLLGEKNPRDEILKKKIQKLHTAWDQLKEDIVQRRKKLTLSLTAQQFVSTTERCMAEKTDLLNSPDVGKDEDAALKLLTEHKALELELVNLSGVISRMDQVIVSANHPGSKFTTQQMRRLNEGIKNLQELASQRRQRLVDSVSRHELLREAESILIWISEQIIAAASKDYGLDYEQYLVLHEEFQVYKLGFGVGSGRFDQCDIAQRLIASENPYAMDFPTKREELRAEWSRLLETIKLRDEKMAAAGDIHLFNRDVAMSLSRIQEKFVAIPKDLGQDLDSVLELIRQHESYGMDVKALEAQFQVLFDGSSRLQAAYPGLIADHIRAQETLVVQSLNALKAHMGSRTEELQAALTAFHPPPPAPLPPPPVPARKRRRGADELLGPVSECLPEKRSRSVRKLFDGTAYRFL